MRLSSRRSALPERGASRLLAKKAKWLSEAKGWREDADRAIAILQDWEKTHNWPVKKSYVARFLNQPKKQEPPVAIKSTGKTNYAVEIRKGEGRSGRKGIEVVFSSLDEYAIIQELRANGVTAKMQGMGFKFSRSKKLWYAGFTRTLWHQVQQEFNQQIKEA